MWGWSYLLYQAAWCSLQTPRGLICGFATMCDVLKKVQKKKHFNKFYLYSNNILLSLFLSIRIDNGMK